MRPFLPPDAPQPWEATSYWKEKEWTGCAHILALLIWAAFSFLAGMLYGPCASFLTSSQCTEPPPEVVVNTDENEESTPPLGEAVIFAPPEVSLDLSDPDAPPPETIVLVDLVDGEVTAAGLEVGDQGMLSEVALQPIENTTYSVGRHRYVTTAEGAAAVVHLFGPIVDPEGGEPTAINLSLIAQSVTASGPITATLAIESAGSLFLLPVVSELTDTGQPLPWVIPPAAMTPVEADGAAFDASRPFRLGVALAVATTEPGVGRFETLFTDPVASVTLPESAPSSGL